MVRPRTLTIWERNFYYEKEKTIITSIAPVLPFYSWIISGILVALMDRILYKRKGIPIWSHLKTFSIIFIFSSGLSLITKESEATQHILLKALIGTLFFVLTRGLVLSLFSQKLAEATRFTLTNIEERIITSEELLTMLPETARIVSYRVPNTFLVEGSEDELRKAFSSVSWRVENEQAFNADV
jgi:hypothetical protein